MLQLESLPGNTYICYARGLLLGSYILDIVFCYLFELYTIFLSTITFLNIIEVAFLKENAYNFHFKKSI